MGKSRPHILVFTSNNISDPGVDLAGSSHMSYSPSAVVISVPCTSGIKPEWVLYALERGFDGVFIAADGTDCPYMPDCTKQTGLLIQRAQELLKEKGFNPSRLKMAAICSVCAESFVSHTEKFSQLLSGLVSA